MSLINQPFDGQLGDILIERLQEDYNRLTIVVAFAKNSGVLRLKAELEQFKANGGTITAFVGVDLQGTSYEALKNLASLCNSLYVVHSEDSVTTFHPKIFLLESDTKIWISVGSNNLTGGGLWTNFESSICQEHIIGTPECDLILKPFSELIEQYLDADNGCSRKITSEDDINELLGAGYIVNEAKQQIAAQNNIDRARTYSDIKLFGRMKRAKLPQLPSNEDKRRREIQVRQGETVRPIHAIDETNSNERIWFEDRVMTGGSRNILDLSKSGIVTKGSGAGSRYETDDTSIILGSVTFFDIHPEDISVVKNITINYNGVDYFGSTIFMQNTGANPNGSWRIRLNGKSAKGVKFHTVNGKMWLQYEIFIFEKIRTDYYALSTLHANSIVNCEMASYVVARNGSSSDSKKYGFLRL